VTKGRVHVEILQERVEKARGAKVFKASVGCFGEKAVIGARILHLAPPLLLGRV
jgi:PII-like signaling protein